MEGLKFRGRTERCLSWVKRRNTRYEQMTSALASTTDEVDGSRSRHLGAKV
jgi:hypothetical protein